MTLSSSSRESSIRWHGDRGRTQRVTHVRCRARFLPRRQTRSRPRTLALVVPTRLPRLPTEQALATVELPIHLNWSAPGRRFDLRDRHDRARLYEIVLREGTPDDVLRYIDGALLVDLWDELVLPREIRSAWSPVIEDVTPATRAA